MKGKINEDDWKKILTKENYIMKEIYLIKIVMKDWKQLSNFATYFGICHEKARQGFRPLRGLQVSLHYVYICNM